MEKKEKKKKKKRKEKKTRKKVNGASLNKDSFSLKSFTSSGERLSLFGRKTEFEKAISFQKHTHETRSLLLTSPSITHLSRKVLLLDDRGVFVFLNKVSFTVSLESWSLMEVASTPLSDMTLPEEQTRRNWMEYEDKEGAIIHIDMQTLRSLPLISLLRK